jgi:hypothetical protein
LDQAAKTPIDAALKRDHHDDVQLFFQTGIVSVADHLKHGSLLHTAVSSCSENIKLLIEHGADVNETCNNLGALLHVVFKSGSITTTATLIQHGAKVNIHRGEGWYDSTTIVCVHDFRHRDMLRLLIEAGLSSEYPMEALRRLVTANYRPLDLGSIDLLVAYSVQITGGIMWDTKDPKDPGGLPQDLSNMFVVAIYDGKWSKAAYALLLSKVDRQVERLDALWCSAWCNYVEL